MSIIDDKSPICIPFILERLAEHRKRDVSRPFIIGLNGVQGVGKTTLVKALAEKLHDGEGLETLVVSIDDFYLPRAEQVKLAAEQPDNALIQVRGEPGTHDMKLAASFFDALINGQETRIPQYNKSAFAGKGDRVDPKSWITINAPSQPKIQVAILEGWCVGFRSLSKADLNARIAAPSRTLSRHKPEHLAFVNEKLADYDLVTGKLDAFIYLNAEDTEYVYDWRLQQERALRQEKGEENGMTDEQVEKFVDAYYPAYEMYSEGLGRGLFAGREGKAGSQLTLVVGRDRKVKAERVI